MNVPSSRVVPIPPHASKLNPLVDRWPAGTKFIRSHSIAFGATDFNPGFGRGRFHPFEVDGKQIPSLYGGDSLRGAISETVFHDVPIRGPNRRVLLEEVKKYIASSLVALRDLKLIRLHSTGLRRLQVGRTELIESDADRYDETVPWARALYEWHGNADGLVWISRQDDTSKAIMLFGDRVDPAELQIAPPAPLPLGLGRGLDEVLQIAEESNITVIL